MDLDRILLFSKHLVMKSPNCQLKRDISYSIPAEIHPGHSETPKQRRDKHLRQRYQVRMSCDKVDKVEKNKTELNEILKRMNNDPVINEDVCTCT